MSWIHDRARINSFDEDAPVEDDCQPYDDDTSPINSSRVYFDNGDRDYDFKKVVGERQDDDTYVVDQNHVNRWLNARTYASINRLESSHRSTPQPEADEPVEPDYYDIVGGL